MGKALFKLSYEQLKENFVRNRFGEQMYYEKENIEKWLAEQRKADRPEMEENGDGMWNHYLSKLAMFNVFDDAWLFDCMCKFASGAESILEEGYGEAEDQLKLVQRIKPLLTALHSCKTDAEIFYCHTLGVIVFFPADMSFMGIKENVTDQTHIALKPFGENPGADSFQLFDVIFATWMRGLQKDKEARDFLCDLLATDIAETRKEAEKDFDEAVAVSEDGRKIVMADRIIVFEPGKKDEAKVFQGKLFTNIKILRSETMHRACDEFCSAMSRGKGSDQYYIENYRGTGSELITQKKYCPDPLPDGGEKITQ